MGERSEEHSTIPPDATPDVVGVPVDVRSRFEGNWCGGFEIAEVLADLDRVLSYRIRRVSDGETLPGTFPAEDIEWRGGGRL